MHLLTVRLLAGLKNGSSEKVGDLRLCAFAALRE